MSPMQLFELIQSDSQAAALAAAGNDAGCAVRCNEIAPKVLAETRLGYISIAAALGASVARRLIVSVNAIVSQDPLVEAHKPYLVGVGIDVANADVRGMLDAFAASQVPGGMTEDDAAQIKAMAERSQNITANQVSAAMLSSRPDGKIGQ